MTTETIIQWAAGLLAYTALGIVLYGIWRGTRQQMGRTVGHAGGWLRSWWFYLISTMVFLGIAWLGWKPLPWLISPVARLWMLVFGSLLYFPGMALLVWARLTLGRNYFVSSGFSAQLFMEHQLIIHGPYTIIRHPMYVGLIIAGLGSLLIYFTWTAVSFAIFAPFTLIRARREEAVLSVEFGEQWQEYYRRVPAFFPRFRKV